MNTIQFGFHLTLDLYGCELEPLNNMLTCFKALEKLPEKLDMKTLVPPIVVNAEANDLKDPGGFSGFVIIAESHISLHTFAKRGFVSIDCYSCKEFEKEVAVEYFKEIFKPKDIEMNFINRGTRYPDEDIYN